MVTGSRDEPQTDFIFCCGANTEVLKFGSCQLHSGHKILFLIIPDASSAAEADVFGLNGQIEHKLAFLRKHVPKETNLILVGHSIGCYIILEMIKRDPELKILKAVMLFPTIERMAQTPQGKVMTPVLCHMRYVAYLPLFLLSLLPDRFKSSLIKLVFAMTQMQLSLFIANAMYMGGQEMKNVLERDNITIKNNLEKLIFYYGATDHWCPVQYYLDIKQDFPHGDIRLCENGFRHAFVLDAGGEVAKMVVEWIHGDLRT
uniref:Lipid droplet-associated hydrolase n=1 Tax=Seriola lalandi dorsalis TaxID=1841481 RepID=A0A3B4YNY3_SERLL